MDMDNEEKERLDQLEKRIGYHFKDRKFFITSLTHPSYCDSKKSKRSENNQRFEFLGDAVLSLVIADKLIKAFPRKREGTLTQNRSRLSNGKQLSELARELGIDKCLRLSEREAKSGGRQRDSILEDALEALVGAIYLDSDFETVYSVVLGWYGSINKRLSKGISKHNPKGRLQEKIQPTHGNDAIEYKVIEEQGPDHEKTFKVQLYINGTAVGEGEGASKKEAEENAAFYALQDKRTKQFLKEGLTG
jgi:ribonuclease III